MESQRTTRLNGIANFFKEAELKSLFLRYIQLIILVEIIILIMVLVGYAASESKAFPTKAYLYLAFGVPLAITFLLGAVIQAFGKFIYGDRTSGEERQEEGSGLVALAPRGIGHGLWRTLLGAPYLIKMLLFLACIVFLFKFEDLFGFLVRAGGQAFDSLVLIGGLVVGGGTILGIIWMLVVFRLKAKQMDYHHQYRQEILERLELMVLNDETIVDKSGNIVTLRELKQVGEPDIELDVEYHHSQPDLIEEKTGTDEAK